ERRDGVGLALPAEVQRVVVREVEDGEAGALQRAGVRRRRAEGEAVRASGTALRIARVAGERPLEVPEDDVARQLPADALEERVAAARRRRHRHVADAR